MKKKLFIIFFALLPALIKADIQEDFTLANNYYSDGSFEQASELYEQILQTEKSAEVYYNLGNTYFRMGELAKSILAYERALRIYPNYQDAKYNLTFVSAQIVDNIDDSNTFFLRKGAIALRNVLHENTWTWLSIICFVAFLVLFMLYLFGESVNVRKVAFYVAFVMLFVSIVSGRCASSLHARDYDRNEAIITQGIVNAKASPDRSGTDIFTLHEGTKVVIHEVIGQWCEIHVGNNVGWIMLSNLECI